MSDRPPVRDRRPVLAGAEPWSSPGSGERAEIGVAVVHGFTGNPIPVRPLAEAVAAAGYAVDVPRLPGHGTHWRDLARTRYEDWRAGAEAAFDRLAGACRAVVMVGFSFGGTLCLDLAATRCRAGDPAPLAGVVTINSPILDREDPLARLAPVLQYLVPLVPSALAGVTKNDSAKGGDERAYAWLPAKAGHAFSRGVNRVRRLLPDVTVPVLVAHSLEDHVVPPENGAAIIARLGSDDVTDLPLERSYHLAPIDHDAELLVDQVLAFVERVTR